MAEALGFDGRIPAPLLFIEATDEQIHLFMQEPFGRIDFLLTGGTFTTMQVSGRHRLLARKDETTLPENPKSLFAED